MKFQVDSRNHVSEEVRVGKDQEEIAVFRRAGFFIHHLEGLFEGSTFHLKLPAPWSGFRYRLLRSDHELASAKKKRRMHSFDPDRPLIRHMLVEFEIDLQGRPFLLTPDDRHGGTFLLREGDEERGRLAQLGFDDQKGEGDWEADVELPQEGSAPLAAFVAWLVRDGRSGMGI